MKTNVAAASMIALALAACTQTAGSPPVQVSSETRPVARPVAAHPVAARRMSREEARAQACAEAAQSAADTAVGSAVVGGALGIVGAGMWGSTGWATSAAGDAVANAGAVAAEQKMNVAYARGDCD